jgi:DNA-binding beta-propeller fold protein YncE
VHPALFVVPLPLVVGVAPREIALPGAPAQVVATPDRVLVTIRQPSLLVVLDPRHDLQEIGRVALPADAWGLALSPDEKRAMVTSAWAHQVSLVDLEKLEKQWSLEVAREPRGVLFAPDGESAWVSHLLTPHLSKLVWKDDKPSAKHVPLASNRTHKAYTAEYGPSPQHSFISHDSPISLSYALALSADGQRLYAPRHALVRAGKGSWFGSGTVDTLLLATEKAEIGTFTDLGDDPDTRPSHENRFGGKIVLPHERFDAFVQPRAAVYRASTRTLIVASEGDDRLVEMDGELPDPALHQRHTYPLGARSQADAPPSCGAPGGLVLSRDERTVYVLCRSTFEVAAVPLEERRVLAPSPSPPAASAADAASGSARGAGAPGSGAPGSGAPGSETTPPAGEPLVVPFAHDPLPEKEAWGRRLFYDARDPLLSGGMGCAGCHPEGRDDGHVWWFSESPITKMDILVADLSMVEEAVTMEYSSPNSFPRQTPMLAGRLTPEGPYGWLAQNAVLSARVMEGFQLHRWTGTTVGRDARTRADALALFARAGLVPPTPDRHPLTAVERRGQELFSSEEVGCAGCHPPATMYTNKVPYHIQDMSPNFDDHDTMLYKTPSLLFVGSTPPYLHDGRAASLSPADRQALVAFLKTL